MKRFLIAVASIAALAVAVYARFVRPWFLRWGATDAELSDRLPGDDRVRDARLDATRALTIDAPIEAVWPWLAQIGQRRGGFYSYAKFENLFGTRMRNADRVHDEWQNIDVGDKVYLHPLVGVPVTEVDPGRSFVLGDSWAFVLRPIDDTHTRLIVRGRNGYTFPNLVLPPLNFLYWRGLYEPLHFIMERGMMLGLKERAERAWREQAASAATTSAP
jgi:hypothetical protein